MADGEGVLDALDELVFAVDDTGRLREWNRAFAEATGYSQNDLQTAVVGDVFPNVTVDVLARSLSDGEPSDTVDATRLTDVTGSGTLVVDLDPADGDRAPFELSVSASDSGDLAFACIGRALSRRSNAERERNDVTDRMSDGFFSLDTDWTVTYANERGREVLAGAMGLDDGADVVGRNLWDSIPEVLDTTFEEKYHEAMETQELVTFEDYYEPIDTWFDVRAYPSETGLSVYFYDITESRRVRQTLANRERVLREMHDVIADHDDSFEEKVTALIELARDELGTGYGALSRIAGDDYVFEMVDTDHDDVEPGDVVPLSATNCEIAATDRRTLVLGNVARDAPEETDRAGYTDWGVSCYIGAPVFVGDDVYGTFCFYDTDPLDGQFSEWEVTLVDLLSRWVSYELQREQATEKLQRQNEKLERFASVVSHDLRSPLNVLEGNLELARADPDGEVDFADAFAMLDRMNTLIDDMLSLARAGAVIDETRPVALSQLAEAAWEHVETSAGTLVVDTDRVVHADPDRATQLFANLVRNAMEHAGPAATVTVGDLPDGFYVADDGPGIPESDRETVRESGYTTSDDGTGFGLTIVDEIAGAHEWTLTVAGADDGGARFEFENVSFAD